MGGAHADWQMTADILREALVRNLEELHETDPDDLLPRRWEKYLGMGEWREIKLRA
jgi:acetyl-CoA carboxylase carboxyl transferase subunit alpha